MIINCSKCNTEIITTENIFYCNKCKTKYKLTIQILTKYKCKKCNKQYESTEPNIENIVHYCQTCLCEDFI